MQSGSQFTWLSITTQTPLCTRKKGEQTLRSNWNSSTFHPMSLCHPHANEFVDTHHRGWTPFCTFFSYHDWLVLQIGREWSNPQPSQRFSWSQQPPAPHSATLRATHQVICFKFPTISSSNGIIPIQFPTNVKTGLINHSLSTFGGYFPNSHFIW